MEWWDITKCKDFVDYALLLASKPVDGLDPWRDGFEVIKLIGKLKEEEYFNNNLYAIELAEKLETSYKNMLEQHAVSSDDLENISDAIDLWGNSLSDEVKEVYKTTVQYEFDNVHQVVSEIDSESELQDYIEMLEKLGKRTGFVDDVKVSEAIEIVHSRIYEIQEEEELDDCTPNLKRNEDEKDKFDDAALYSFFQPLLDIE